MKKCILLMVCVLALLCPICALGDGAPFEMDVYNEVNGAVIRTGSVASDADYAVLESLIPLPGTLWDTVLDAVGTIQWQKIAYMQDGQQQTGWIVGNRDVLLSKESLSTADTMTGFVLCESLSIRQSPSSSAKAVATMAYGSSMTITDWEGDWMRVSWAKSANSTRYEGWVRSEYVLVDPPMYVSGGETPVYAYPGEESPRIGLLSKGDQHPIVARLDGYTVISLRGASGFIRN